MNEAIFFIIGVSICVFGILTVTSRNIFHSAVWLSLCLINIAAVYFLLNAAFVGVIQVLVYIGGIITLFVFAIKLTAHIGDATILQTNRQFLPSALASLILLVILITAVKYSPWNIYTQSATAIGLKDIGRSLLTTYILPFEYISIVLLAVMIGAIVIGKVKK